MAKSQKSSNHMADALAPEILLDIRTQLEEAAAEMDATLRQAASAGAIARHGSSAAGCYAADGSVLVGGRESHPLLLEAAAEALAALVDRPAPGVLGLAAGAAYATNDPRMGAAGIEDLVVAAPVFRRGCLAGFVAVSASHPGLGRAAVAPVEALRREGLVLPWSPLGDGRGVDPVLRELLAANVEEAGGLLEDLQAQLHSVWIGVEVVERLLDRHGPESLDAVRMAIRTSGLDALQGILRKSQGAVLEGHLPPVTAQVTPEDPGVLVKLSSAGEPPELPPVPLARAAVRAAFRELLAAETPGLGLLGGWSDAIRVEVAWPPAAGTGAIGPARLLGAQRVAEVVLAAVATLMPHLTRCPDSGPLLAEVRGERGDGSRYRLRLEVGGGLGASVFGDGLTHAAASFHPQHLRSVEAIERTAPLRVHRFALRPDSAGAGQYRGGLGAVLEISLLEGRALVDVLLPARPMGLRGGRRGAAGRLVHLTPEAGAREETGPARISLGLRPGDRLILESPGGGAWGLGYERSIMRVEEDLVRGLVTPTESKNQYGVVVRPGTLEKDDQLTYRVRHFLLSTLAAEDIIAGEELLD
jgi:N-methylhydantoinase B